MKVYKGTDKNMVCDPTGHNPFQYELGVTYEKPKAELCAHGFHACEAPLDVFSYYAPGAGSRYFEADLEDVSPERESDSKVCGKKITLGAEIGIPGLVKAHVEWVKSNIDETKKQTVVPGDYSSASNTGDYSSASVDGMGSVAIVTGYQSEAKANLGSAIVVCERGAWNGSTYPLLAIKAAIVDGETLKPNTWYTLKNGEFVEVDD